MSSCTRQGERYDYLNKMSIHFMLGFSLHTDRTKSSVNSFLHVVWIAHPHIIPEKDVSI